MLSPVFRDQIDQAIKDGTLPGPETARWLKTRPASEVVAYLAQCRRVPSSEPGLSVSEIYAHRREVVAALNAQPHAAPAPAVPAVSERWTPDDVYAARRKSVTATRARRAFATATVEDSADEEADD